jgi:hypothetical protein
LEEGEVIEVLSLPTPKGISEGDALNSLRVRVRDALDARAVVTLALWLYEGSPRGISVTKARPVLRAEGAVLSAAGDLGLPVIEISPTSRRKSEGHRKNEDLVAARISNVGGTWDADADRAVAAATYV